MRVTPACRARAIISARSPSNSGTCRCAWVSKSSRLTGASQVRGSRRHSESHAPDELARRRRHVHRPSPLRIGGKAGLTRSEERRVGKECRSRWSTYAEEKKKQSE